MTPRTDLIASSDDEMALCVAKRPPVAATPRRDRWCPRRPAGAIPSLRSRQVADGPTTPDPTGAPGGCRRPPSVAPKASLVGRGVSELTVSFERRGGVLVARLAGNLDIDTVPALHEQVAAASRTRTPLVLDLSLVDLMDSSGLGALIALRNRAAADGRQLGLVSGDGQLRDVLGIAGLERAFLHAPDVDSACSLLAERIRQPNPPRTR